MNKKKTIITFFLIMSLVAGVILFFSHLSNTANNTPKVSSEYYKLSPPQANFSVGLGLEENQPQISISQKESNLSLVYPMINSKISKEEDFIVYKSSDNKSVIKYKNIPNGIKEEIVLYQPPESNRFELKMKISNSTYGINADNLPIFFDQKGKYLYHFQKPYAVDSRGNNSYALLYNIRKLDNDQYLLILTVNSSWLNDPERKYPVIVDPTVVYDPKNSRPEVIEQRSNNSKTFANNDGSFTSKFWGLPVHYLDNQNKWQEIDTTITPSSNVNYDYMNITNTNKIYFNKKITVEKPNIMLEKNGSSITFDSINSLIISNYNSNGQEVITENKDKNDLVGDISTLETAKVEVMYNDQENRLLYPPIYKNENKTIQFAYNILDYKLEEQIILNEFLGFPEISQQITLNNAYIKQENDTIAIYQKQTKELLWEFPRPYMFEQKNPDNINYGLHFEIKCNFEEPIDECQELTLTKVLEHEGKKWLANSSRQYPIVIDPDYAGHTDDGHIAGNNATYSTARSTSTSFNTTNSYAVVGQDPTNASAPYQYDINRAFFLFDTNTIDDEAYIEEVFLSMTGLNYHTDANFDVEIVDYNWTNAIAAGNQEANYDGCLSAASTVDATWLNTASMVDDTQYTRRLLNTWPSTTGYTKYCIISSNDIAASPPYYSWTEEIRLYTQNNATTGYRPVLTIVWVSNPGLKFSGVKIDGVKINLQFILNNFLAFLKNLISVAYAVNK